MPTVTVSKSADNKFVCTPDCLSLLGDGENIEVDWVLDPSLNGYRFKTAREDSTYGVDFTSPKPCAGAFSNWTANNPQVPTVVSCTAQNTDGKTWTYDVNLVKISTGEQITIDPTIRDQEQ